MRLISKNSEISSRQIADGVGISNGSAYYVLTAPAEKGFVKLGNFKNNPRKRQYDYLFTHSFIERKRQEFENLKAEIETLEEAVGMTGAAIPVPLGDKR